MTTRQVTWELSGGVRALRTLGDMLYEVANNCGCHTQLTGDRSSMGVYLDKRAYWLGIYYDQPEFLVFATHNRPVIKEKAACLGIDGVYEWETEPGYGWRRQLDLESEEVHFFARSKASQMQLLETFLKDCLATVNHIEVTGQDQTAAAAGEPEAPEPESPSD